MKDVLAVGDGDSTGSGSVCGSSSGSGNSFYLELLRKSLLWAHLCPTAPGAFIYFCPFLVFFLLLVHFW